MSSLYTPTSAEGSLPEQTLSRAWRARSVWSLVAICQCRIGIGDGLPTNRLALSNGPHVHEPGLDRNPAGAPDASLVNDDDELVAARDDPLRLDAETLEALEPAAKEAHEAVAATMRAGLGARSRLMPLELGVEQLDDDREVTAVESGIRALERVNVRVAHATAVHHVALAQTSSSVLTASVTQRVMALRQTPGNS